jgi:hypothetical protein
VELIEVDRVDPEAIETAHERVVEVVGLATHRPVPLDGAPEPALRGDGDVLVVGTENICNEAF